MTVFVHVPPSVPPDELPLLELELLELPPLEVAPLELLVDPVPLLELLELFALLLDPPLPLLEPAPLELLVDPVPLLELLELFALLLDPLVPLELLVVPLELLVAPLELFEPLLELAALDELLDPLLEPVPLELLCPASPVVAELSSLLDEQAAPSAMPRLAADRAKTTRPGTPPRARPGRLRVESFADMRRPPIKGQ